MPVIETTTHWETLAMQNRHESLTVQFSGPAFEEGTLRPSAVAQSLVALDRLLRQAAEALCLESPQKPAVDLTLTAAPDDGAFIMEIGISSSFDEIETPGTILLEMLRVALFCRGEEPMPAIAPEDADTVQTYRSFVSCDDLVVLTDSEENIKAFRVIAVDLYREARTRSRLACFAQTLDAEGVDAIRLFINGNEDDAVVVTKENREGLRPLEGRVLADNESAMLLSVVGPKTDATKENVWVFDEGEGGILFAAPIEDAFFLRKVRSGEIELRSGTRLLTSVRTVQYRAFRQKTLTTERSIVEVIDVMPAKPSKRGR